MSLAIRNLTKSALPRLPYKAIAEQVLGLSVSEVSLTFIGPSRSHELNRIYRGKDKPANILTFPLAKNEGEILIDLITTRAEAARTGALFTDYLRHLFIHGLLHLKGFDHGSRMESLERDIISFFSRYGQNHRHRTRRRHSVGQSCSLRSH